MTPKERARLEKKIIFWGAVALALIIGPGLYGLVLLSEQWGLGMEDAQTVCSTYACCFPAAGLVVAIWAFKRGWRRDDLA